MFLQGLLGGGLSFLMVVGATEYLAVDSRLAYPAAVVLVSCANFFICRHMIFGAVSEGIARQALRFAGSIGFFRIAEIIAFAALATIGLEYRIAFVLVAGTSFVAKVLTTRRYVFPR
jgi:hypothetical protein